MGLDTLLARLSGRTDTPDTPCNPVEVSAKPAWIEACTLDTPDTPQIIKCCENATSKHWLIHFADRESHETTFTPGVNYAGALAPYPDAVAAEPIADMQGNQPSTFQAEIDVDRNSSILPTIADIDDRRQCFECLNLRKHICSVAKPERGALVVANVGYRPQADILHRCAGYLPNATDNDQRPGRERWPVLIGIKRVD
jgi:hypothetical protein